MAPRKRHHPHTREEWNDIRPRFTELYQTQGKKLSDVVKTLGEQGFHAKECHYKTYIRKWGLERNNKQSDMVFAIRKLRERQEKDTVFFIRGQKRSCHEVQHYWRRKRLDPLSCSTDPTTPEGFTYRTPSPTPHENILTAGGSFKALRNTDLLLVDNQSSGSTHDASSKVSIIQAFSWTFPYKIGPPTSVKVQEQDFHYVQIYCRSYVEHFRDAADPELWDNSTASIDCSCKGRTTLSRLLISDFRWQP